MEGQRSEGIEVEKSAGEEVHLHLPNLPTRRSNDYFESL
jgi:hypothetical protein